MRRLVASAFGIALAVGAFTGTSAQATCMETFDKFGIRHYSCAPPGGPAQSYLCIHDTCYPI